MLVAGQEGLTASWSIRLYVRLARLFRRLLEHLVSSDLLKAFCRFRHVFSETLVHSVNRLTNAYISEGLEVSLARG